MNKQLFAVLLGLFALGCGDDLGWEKQAGEVDCPHDDADTTSSEDSDSGDQPDLGVDGGGDDTDGVSDGLDTVEVEVGSASDATEVADEFASDTEADIEADDIEADDIAPDSVTPDPDANNAPDADANVPLPPECTEATDCNDSLPCTFDSCDNDGKCLHDKTLLDDTPCVTDSSVCTLEKCLDGKCLGAGEVYCDDQNPCTDDLCDALNGCEYWPNIAPCSDGNACTQTDMCAAKVCVAGPLVNCDDGNDCTLDACDIATGCTVTDAPDGTPCVDGFCKDGLCGCASYGCAAPSFVYSSEVAAGMLGGMGGGVGPKMGCATTDVLIGIGFDFSPATKTVTRTTVVCGTVTADGNGVVSTTQTTTEKSGGSGCYGWDPSDPTPLAICPIGWVIVGIEGKCPSSTLFHSVSVTCAKLNVDGTPSDILQTTPVVGTNGGGSGTPQSAMCPAGTIARYFETRAGCGQDALTLYCAKATPTCAGQPIICKE